MNYKKIFISFLLYSFSLFAMDDFSQTKKFPSSKELDVHPNQIKSMSFHPNKKYILAITGDLGEVSRDQGQFTGGPVRLWDLETKTWVQEFNYIESHDYFNSIRCFCDVEFHPDGKTLAAGDLDGNVIRWDIKSGKKIAQLERYGVVSAVSHAPDGLSLAYGTRDHKRDSVYILDLRKVDKPKKSYKPEGALGDIDYSCIKLMRGILVAGMMCDGIRIWDLQNDKETVIGKDESKTYSSDLAPIDLQSDYSSAFDVDAEQKIALIHQRKVKVYAIKDLQKGTFKPLYKQKDKGRARVAKFRPKTTAMAINCIGKDICDSYSVLWDPNKKNKRFNEKRSFFGHHMAFSLDGSTLVTVPRRGIIKVWDINKIEKSEQS